MMASMRSPAAPRTRIRSVALLAAILAVAHPVAGATRQDAPRDPAAGNGPSNLDIRGIDPSLAAAAKKAIADEVRLIESEGATMARADDAAYFLQLWLLRQGYAEAQVDWQLPGGNQVVLEVRPGILHVIGTVEITGATIVSADKIRAVLLDETRQRLGLAEGDDVPVVRADLEAGSNRLRELYRLSGYVEASVETEIEQVDSHRREVNLRIQIDEGPRFVIGTIALPEFPETALEETVRQGLADRSGQAFNAETAESIRRTIIAAAINDSYLSAEVSVTEAGRTTSPDGVTVDFAVAVSWGRPFVVDGFRVQGNDRVRDLYFHRQFDRFVGERYSIRRIDRTVNRMLRSGAFQRVTADPALEDDHRLFLDVEVQEAKSSEVGIYGGWGSYEGAITGLQYRNNNLFGLVRRLDSQIEYNQRGGSGHVRYESPEFLGTGFDFAIEALAQFTDHEGYSKWEVGPRSRLVRKFGEKDQHEFAIYSRFSYTDVHDFDIDEEFIGQSPYFLHEAGITIAYDGRDDPLNPRRGFAARLSAGGASATIGSEIDFTKVTGNLSYDLPIGPTTVRLGARAGVIAPTGDTEDIPIDLRFFSGGSRSVRSFRERDLGPKDSSNYPIGGEFFSTYSAEYGVPVWKGIELAAFADAGNLLRHGEDAGFEEMHYAAGLGLRYHLPIGPLRIDYGWNLNRDENEPSGTLHIGFGFAF